MENRCIAQQACQEEVNGFVPGISLAPRIGMKSHLPPLIQAIYSNRKLNSERSVIKYHSQ